MKFVLPLFNFIEKATAFPDLLLNKEIIILIL